MPKFRVLVTRDATESCHIEVEAESAREAEGLALEVAGELGKWELDDCNYHSPYIADPGNCARRVTD